MPVKQGLESMGRTQSTPAGEVLVIELPLDGETLGRKVAPGKFAQLAMPSDMTREELALLSPQLRSIARGFEDLARAWARATESG